MSGGSERPASSAASPKFKERFETAAPALMLTSATFVAERKGAVPPPAGACRSSAETRGSGS